MDELNATDEHPPESNKALTPANERDKGKAPKKRVSLTQVYPEPGFKYHNEELKNDVVALHGLDAESPKTWVAWRVDGDEKSGDVNWLQDPTMLPKFMPNSRILTYQWNANYEVSASSDRFSGHAKTLLQDLHANRSEEGRKGSPIIFIASCFGGLLLAKALVTASHPSEPGHHRDYLILQHTIGAAFLGTPFRGSWDTGSDMAQVRYKTALASGTECSQALIELLKQGTPDRPSPLDDLVNHFHSLIHNDKYRFPVVCVYETRVTDLSAFKKRLGADFKKMGLDEYCHGIVVNRNSATIGGTEEYGFDVRHNMLHKFNSSTDSNFKKLKEWLMETAENAEMILGRKDHDESLYALYDNRIQHALAKPVTKTDVAPRPWQTPPGGSSKADTQLCDLPDSRMRRNPRKQEGRDKLYLKLCFQRLEERYNMISLAHPYTCTWLLTNKKYQAWLDKGKLEDHHGVLWLKGNPGTGKSTLMKFAVLQLSTAHPRDIQISFFFNARGVDLEKSTLGMYRSLLYQLFTRIPRLQYVFDDFTRLEVPESERQSWTVSQLQLLLIHAISELENYKLWVFVDALDEGNEKEVRAMITFFGQLGEKAKQANVDMRVFFASRHYPQIMISKKVELILESENEHYLDIKRYIQSELYIKDNITAKGIENEVIQRASGVFLWVVLVVEILNEAALKGMNQKERLQELPDDLSNLFEGILTRDSVNMRGTQLCVQWVLFSQKPLSREELYFAILHGANEREAKSWSSDYISVEIMDAFILTCSKGLVQFIGETAQFIHETVRDFLLHGNGMQLIASGSTQSVQGAAHDTLKSCCLNCISSTLEIVWGAGPVRFEDFDMVCGTDDSIFKSRWENHSNSKAQYKTPFLHYVLVHLLDHANAAEAGGVSQVSFIQKFQPRPWVYLRKIFLNLGTFRSLGSTLLYTLAEQDLGCLIRAMLRANPELDVDSGNPDSPIRIALFQKHYDALIALLSPTLVNSIGNIDRDCPTEPEIDHLIRAYLLARHQMRGSSILQFFFQWGDEIGILTLLRSGRFSKDGNILTAMRCSPLSAAVERGYERLVQFLLRGDLDVNLRDEDKGLPPLSRAARNGRLEVAQLLVQDPRTKVNLKCKNFGKSPLSYAAEKGFLNLVQLLLRQPNVEVNTLDNDGRSPMFHAARKGHGEIVQLLLHTPGNDPIAEDNHRYTALAYATLHGHEDVVNKLLENGQVQDDSLTEDSSKTPLSIAYQFKRHSIAQLLRRHPMTNIVDVITGSREANEYAKEHNVTSLWWAALKGNHLLVRELLSHGDVDLNFRDAKYGRTPLWCAAAEGHEAVVRLLLQDEEGVDLEYKDTEYGQTPLCVAARFGNRGVVRLMLARGDIALDCPDFEGRTPWIWANIREDDLMMGMLGDR